MQDPSTGVLDHEEAVQRHSVSRIVGTMKKSIAAIHSLWLRRKLNQRWTTSGFAGCRGMYRDTVASEMVKPSFSSSP